MTIRDRIIEALKRHPTGIDDDTLAITLGLKRREQANQRCRALAREGLVERRVMGGKLHNFWLGPTTDQPRTAPTLTDIPAMPKPWCWEGNVVRAVVSHLTQCGWTIKAIADTATGAAGEDIVAVRDGQTLVIEVKGYPSNVYERGPRAGQPKRTNPPTQARHWVAEALLTAILRSNDQVSQVAIAFPEFGVYTKLLTRIQGAIARLGLMVLIVTESGSVQVFQEGARFRDLCTPTT